VRERVSERERGRESERERERERERKREREREKERDAEMERLSAGRCYKKVSAVGVNVFSGNICTSSITVKLSAVLI
jgi:hypothetical protein